MKANSVHFILGKDSGYKDLARVFPGILKMLLEDIDQVPEDEEILEMFIDMNVSDLERDRKPEGYNRKGRIRLVFPMDRKEFYIRSYSKVADANALGDRITSVLKEAKIKFEVKKNEGLEFS
jgi:hypothetical protein